MDEQDCSVQCRVRAHLAHRALGTILGFANDVALHSMLRQWLSILQLRAFVFGVGSVTTATGATSSATTHAIAGSGAGSLLTGYVFGSARRAVLGGILFGAIGVRVLVEAEEWRLRRGQEILAECGRAASNCPLN